MEARINVIQRQSRVLASPKDGAAIYIVEDDIELVRLAGEPAVVEENIWLFPSLNLAGDANGFAGRHISIQNGELSRIRRSPTTPPNNWQKIKDSRQIMKGLYMTMAFHLNSSTSH